MAVRTSGVKRGGAAQVLARDHGDLPIAGHASRW